MANKTIQFKVPTPREKLEWRPTNLAGGVVITDLPQNILDNQSPSMNNMWYKEKVLTKRYGQENFTTGLPSAILNTTYFNGSLIVHSGTKLYSVDKTTGIATQIYASLTAFKGSFFTFKNKATGVNTLYYKNNGSYVQYDGTTVSVVVGYIPKVIMGRAPTGGGTPLEQYNMLSAGFINSFSATGSATAYTLTQTSLDATTVTATLNGVAKVEGTDFTVNRATGIVTFTTAPTSGVDNLLITAYKSSATDTANFNPLCYVATFGGNNDTRVFMAGGSTTYYYSGLLDPSYFPENQYNNAGSSSEFVTGFGKQYNSLIIFKERSLGVVTYQVNSDGSNPQFPYAGLNSKIGCDMPNTIQLINNCLVWCNTYAGVHILISDTQIKDEKNVKPLSHNINGTIQRPGLLQQLKTDMQNATSIDMYGMYWLCVGSNVWAWDYSVSPYSDSGNIDQDQLTLAWFPFDTINANCFTDVDQDLYYGDRTTGNIVHFKNNYTDFGNAINAWWQSKLLNFGVFNWYKYILDLRYDSKTDIFTQVTTTHISDNGNRVDNTMDSVGTFRWDTFNWEAFVWSVINYAKTFRKTIKIPQTEFYSVKFQNNNVGQNLSILDLVIKYILTREIK